jgi:predicted DNA-binding transcriptional regulator AlpA
VKKATKRRTTRVAPLAMALTPEPIVFGTHDVARMFDVTTMTLFNWRARGEGPPCFRLGPKIWAYPRAELLAWIAARRPGGRARRWREGMRKEVVR